MLHSTPLYTESLPACRNKLLHLVAHRCWYYTAGQVSAEKAARVAAKFATRRYVQPVHTVFLFVSAEERYLFWLLTAERASLDAFNEQVSDARDKHRRLKLAGLGLKRVPRSVRHADGHKETRESLTWALTKELRRVYTANGRRYATHTSPKRANRLLLDLAHLPAYGGIRAEREAIYRMMVHARHVQNPKEAPLTYPPLMKHWVNPVRFDATGRWKPFHTTEEAGRKRPGGRLAGRASKPPAAAPHLGVKQATEEEEHDAAD